MQLTSDRIDDNSLAAIGIEAARLVVANDLASLHRCFGYALAFDREPIVALAEDLATTLAELKATGFAASASPKTRVSHFKPNGTGLIGVVECLLPTDNGAELLLELAITTSSSAIHVTLEQFSAQTVHVASGPPNAA
jgi:hypothetical protein